LTEPRFTLSPLSFGDSLSFSTNKTKGYATIGDFSTVVWWHFVADFVKIFGSNSTAVPTWAISFYLGN
jgi:hypothetical protein